MPEEKRYCRHCEEMTKQLVFLTGTVCKECTFTNSIQAAPAAEECAPAFPDDGDWPTGE